MSSVLISACTANEYILGPYDTFELEVINHPELKSKQTITPDGKASLPLLGIIPLEGKTLNDLHEYLSDSYSLYIKNPQVTISLTPKPIYIVQYDLEDNIWEVKMAKSVDEARALTWLDPTLSIEHGNIYKITMSKKPNFWGENWYQVITATAVVAGVYSTLTR
ncbi:polysaccharide biosynthesis/export family protein [Patescibacteria group bacterium]|nr:polysaccharide biosynthesis/export family protein [Patescibacteria group bacterium]